MPPAGEPADGVAAAPTPRWFGWGLAVTLVLALSVRVAYVVRIGRHLPLVGDAQTYHLLARVLADGDGYIRPRDLLQSGLHLQTAEFPPLHPFVLALGDLVGLGSPTAQRALGAVLGVVTVGLIGLLGRRVAGPRAGLVAAALAAVSPVLIENDTSLQAEGLFMLLTAGSLLAIHVAMSRSRPASRFDLVLLGLLLGAAALTRSEAVLLVPVAAVLIGGRPDRARPGGGPRRTSSWLRPVASALGWLGIGAVLVVGTWAVRSSVALGGVVLTSTNAGTLIAGGNCDAVYHGSQKGLWRLDCVDAVDTTGLEHDELARTRRWISAGTHYAADHLGELPSVAAVRVLRTWGLYDPHGQIAWETLEGRNLRWHTLAHRAHLVTLALALVGFVLLRRRHRELALLLTPVVLSILVSLLSGGNTRYRAGADVALVVAAAVAIEVGLRRWWPARATPALVSATAPSRRSDASARSKAAAPPVAPG